MILCLADAGTPLMWVGFLQLTVGNLIVGIVEGLLIARATKSPWGRCMLVMVAANYLSMAIGWGCGDAAAAYAFDHLPDGSLLAIPWVMAAIYAALCLVTFVVEYPVAMWLRNGMTHRAFLRPYLVAQLATTVPLGLVLALASYGTLFTVGHVQARPDFLKPIAATMYYLSDDGTEVRTLRLDTGERGVAKQLGPSRWMRLNVRKGAEAWEVYRESDYHEKGDLVTTVPFGPPHRVVPEAMLERFGSWHPPFFGSHRTSVDWRPQPVPFEKQVATGDYAAAGLSVGSTDLGLEMPFLMPHPSNATVLPTEQVIYCLGFKYIMLVDLETMKVATLTRGNGPVVVLDPPRGT